MGAILQGSKSAQKGRFSCALFTKKVLCRDLREASEHPRSARKRPFGPSAFCVLFAKIFEEKFGSIDYFFVPLQCKNKWIVDGG